MTTNRDALIGTLYDGRYQILARVGVGGMANVYRAEDTTLGREVAIKILNQRYAADDQFVERFMREASAAARLNHPNIVQVYDRGECHETYYIAMEFIDGITLKELIQRTGPLPEHEVLDYTRQALNALRFAHRNGIVHRDIKPHNLMIDNDGRAKIADFGIARAGADSGLTEVGSIVGTAQYLSPEQARGEIVSASSDLYSLGVVMFEMSTGRVPFEGDSPVNVALRHVNDPVPRPRSLNAAISPALEAVILRAMQKDPDLRFQTADAFLDELDRVERDDISAETAAMTRVMAASALATGDPLIPPSSTLRPPPPGSTDHYGSTFADSPLDEEPEASPRWPWYVLIGLLVVVAAAAAIFILNGGFSQARGETVPDLTGKTVAQAEVALEAANLTVGSITKEFDANEPAGRVLSTDPNAGDKLKAGEGVDLVVSKGASTSAVPDLVGETLSDATKLATDAGFELSSTQAYDDAEEGSVIKQSPASGDDAAPGSTITVTVSRGPEAITLSDYTGLRASDAESRLAALGLESRVDKSQDSSTPENQVFEQSPAPGSQVKKGDTVTLRAGSGYNAVPDVTDLSQSDAEQKLRAAGYEVKTVIVADAAAPADGNVTDQQPAAGSRLKLGFTVTITVSSPTTTG